MDTAATIAPRIRRVTALRYRKLSFSTGLLGDSMIGATAAVPRTNGFGLSNGI